MARTTRAYAQQQSSGYSLVELMVAVALGLIILAAMLEGFNASSATGATNTRFTEVQSNGRYALNFLRREIQHAGFAYLSRGAVIYQPSTLPNNDYGCGAGFVTKLEQPIFGYDDPASGSVPCTTLITGADSYARGDILVLRKAVSPPNAPITATAAYNGYGFCPNAAAGLVAGTMYVRTEFLQSAVYIGTTPAANLQSPCDDYLVGVDVYYVSANTSGTDGIPSLKRIQLGVTGGAPAMQAAQVVATGIENMQIQYGVQNGDAVSYVNAGSVAAADWPNVVAVRLWVLARSTEPEFSGFVNTSSYTMGNAATFTPGDNFVRQLHPLIVTLRK